ncbi:bifunctional metallophosphatase/5'-nucleotidase [Actinomadura parmotrematis]|uniref:Bifunctional metallophosphatase/5'-nucleotidase n=1 Tax=Actinomadura parmotrematis TaxID=2864039 RepID=A0ABS7FY85_9ACTN|nr:bifunctional metallophosphatase/5'-nucleotidase [Actinomadura parmotrematis]MBW8485231.1 bifunctional metallophosphatase/5'-nucleotidase [Actinomadura parmotrematis]
MFRPRLTLACAAAAVALAGLTAAPAGAAGVPTADVRLLSLNDFHGNLEPPTGSSANAIDENGKTVLAGGAAYVAAHMKQLRDKNTLEVAQGDLIGASPLISAAYHDEPSVQFMNDLGITASAVGNHEFDEGYKELQRIQWGGCHPTDGCSPAGPWKGAKFDYLAANVTKNKLPILKPWTIRWINGVPVGFIGVVTKTTPTIVTAEGIKGLEFGDEVAAANKAAKQLKLLGVHAMVLLVHEGDNVVAGSKPNDCGVVPGAGTAIAKNADADIDVVLSGHTHQQYMCSVTDPKGQPRLYSSGSSFGRIISQVDFKVNRLTRDVVRSSLKGQNHVVTRDIDPDPDTQTFVETWKDRVASIANKKIGTITADLKRTASPAGESPLGDVIADAQLAATKSLGAQVAVTNPGGIRTDFTYDKPGTENDGVVTYGDAFAVQPFSNVTGVTTLTGAQLDAVLEQQWTSAGEKILQPSSGLHFTIDRSRAVGDRVSNITIDGTPVDPAASYKIAANNFLLGGGDGFTVFTQGTGQVLGPIDLDALVAYFGANSPIAPPALDRISGQ